VRDLGNNTGTEAIRVLKKVEKWIPEKKRGMPVKSTFSFSISVNASEVASPIYFPTPETNRDNKPRW
jgi:hypothetical protein